MAPVPLEMDVFASFREWRYANLEREVASAYRTTTVRVNQTLEASRSPEFEIGQIQIENPFGMEKEVSLHGQFARFLRTQLRLTME